MELNIGTNIKKLRLAKGLTQEQLAELLNVSSAAVSKWEAKNTYPDITMLFPIANAFGVSIDELTGYDAAKIKQEISELLETCRLYSINGEFEKAWEIILTARHAYPNDYYIMNAYMWNKGGDFADNDPEILLNNQDEFMQICDCILDGCTEERLRFDALTMKAKLLHASGDTNGAQKILVNFPTWYYTSEQKTEQLFAKDTPEFRYWVRKNSYDLLSFAADKLVKTVWYDDKLSIEAKVVQIEGMGDAFSSMSRTVGMEMFVIAEYSIYAAFANKLSLDGNIEDIIRIREKEFTAIEAMMRLSESDEVLKVWIEKTYTPGNMLKWIIDWLLTAQQPHLARLRENSTYMNMLSKWNK